MVLCMSFCDVMVAISELFQYMLLGPRLLRQVIVGYECQVTALYIEMVTDRVSYWFTFGVVVGLVD